MGLGVLWDPFPVGIPGGFAPGSLGIPDPGSPVGWGFCTGRETSNPLSSGSPPRLKKSLKTTF